jgi:hypothetical protein
MGAGHLMRLDATYPAALSLAREVTGVVAAWVGPKLGRGGAELPGSAIGMTGRNRLGPVSMYARARA